MATETQTLEEQLAATEAAITAVEERGQKVVIKDREIWRGDLRTLYSEREKLRRLIEIKRSRGSRVRFTSTSKGL